MAGDLNIFFVNVTGNTEKVNTIDLKSFETETVGSYTLNDIREELLRPGRDPREKFVAPHFREDVREIGDLKEGMVLEGTVSNVANFGAFVDIGVHQDGLVHISQLSNRYIKDPTQAVKVGDIVKVKVLGVDVEQKRISLSMRALLPPAPAHRRRKKGGSKSKGGDKRPPVQAGDGRSLSVQQRTPDGRERRPRPPKRPHREGRPRQAASPQQSMQQSMQQPASSAQRAPDLSMEERIALLQAKFRPIR